MERPVDSAQEKKKNGWLAGVNNKLLIISRRVDIKEASPENSLAEITT
jgi:hypothetical protein